MKKFIKHITLKRFKSTDEYARKRVEMYCKEHNVTFGNLKIAPEEITFTAYSNISYENLTNQLIAERYTIQDELAIQRKHQKGINEIEFNEYDAYVEECKLQAKAFIEERESALNK